LTSYASLGAVAGTLGATLQQARVVGLVLAALFLFYFAARVAGLLPEVGVNLPGVGRAIKAARGMSGASGGFVLGASTALLPCGLVYAALALPVVAASPLQGAATMGMMWVGTLPALLGVALLGRRIPRANRAARYALAAALLVSGLYGLWQRAPSSADEGQSSCCAHEG
jgi:sulfite exporter TauE/SafE